MTKFSTILLSSTLMALLVGLLAVPSASAEPLVTVAHAVDQYGALCVGVFLGPEDFIYTYTVVCAGKLEPLDCPVYIDANEQNGGTKACL